MAFRSIATGMPYSAWPAARSDAVARTSSSSRTRTLPSRVCTPMVRLDSEGAFVANLSERDPIWVAEQPVRSGQEVGLPLGARIRIGAYTLAAVAPGTPFEAPPSAAMQNAQATQAAQAAPPATAAPQPQIVPPPVAAQPPLPEAAPPAEAAPLADVLPAAGPGIADPWEGLTALSLDAIQTPAVPSIESAIPPEQAALAMPQPAKPQHRPLLIPNDFDPFAPPPQQARQQEEGWAGLPSQGTGDLIQQRHDGMVHTLPLKGLSTEALHDASHTGLPSCFEQSQKLDPLALFDQGGLPPDAQPLQQASGPGLRTGPGLQSAAHAIACTARRAGATAGGGSTGPACTPACDRYRDSCSAGAASCTGGRHGHRYRRRYRRRHRTFRLLRLPRRPCPRSPPSRPRWTVLLPTNGLDLDLFKSGLAHVAPVARAAVAAASAPPLDAGVNVNIPAASSILGQGDAAIPIGAMPSTAAPVDIPVQPQPAASADLQALAAAFMEGAGLNPAKTHFEVTPEFMRTFGEALRIAVQGTIDPAGRALRDQARVPRRRDHHCHGGQQPAQVPAQFPRACSCRWSTRPSRAS